MSDSVGALSPQEILLCVITEHVTQTVFETLTRKIYCPKRSVYVVYAIGIHMFKVN